jgi:hypothetical protein
MADAPKHDVNDGDPGQHWADGWRADPKALREAVRSAREAYQRTPKAASRLPDAGCLVGESRGGTVVYGVVVADAAGAGDVYAKLPEIAATVGQVLRGHKARIEVFVPPDWSSSGPTSIAGVRVDWLRWVPASEHEIRVEKMVATPGESSIHGSASVSDSVIARLLGHLAWWEKTLRDSTGSATPHRKALLVLNAATLLEWHFTVPGKDSREQFQNAKAREKAGKVIRELIEVAREAVAKTEGATGAKVEKQLGKLADATAKAVKKLGKLYHCAANTGRCAEFEKPLKPAALISAWLAANSGGAPEAAAGGNRGPVLGGGGGELVLKTLLPAITAEKLFDEGKLSAEAYTAVRQASADFLEDAVAIAADRSKGAAKKRWRQVGRPAAEAFRRPVATRFGKGES